MYNWDGKEAECYRLYVQEKKGIDEVMAYWETKGFTPSKRAFQTQFRRWQFPAKFTPAHQNGPLVARVRGLWEQNYTQKEMLDTLGDEGFSINSRELIRLRLRYKLNLRESAPKKGSKRTQDDGEQGPKTKSSTKRKRASASGKNLIAQLGAAILADEVSSDGEESEKNQFDPEIAAEETRQKKTEPETAPLGPDEALRREIRQQQLLVESAEKWRTKKRRRRTRGWAGLPADKPGEPPRFPSETTLDESKAYLGLDNKRYPEVRRRFQNICEAHGVIKKTIAGPDLWAQLIQQLIREDSHLSAMFEQEPEVFQSAQGLYRPTGQKALSIDVICMDVTKRLRSMDSRFTISEVKSVLGLNPEQGRQVRHAFEQILENDHFKNRLEAGDAHWNELKQNWVDNSELLTKSLKNDKADERQYEAKVKAIDAMARDISKRYRHKKVTQDPNEKKQIHQGPGPGPAPPKSLGPASRPASTRRKTAENPSNNISMTQANYNPPTPAMSIPSDLQIDPSLLLAASDASILPPLSPDDPTHRQPQQTQHQSYSPQPHARHNSSYYQPQQHHIFSGPTNHATSYHTHTPLPIYFRLHPHSTTPLPNKSIWLSILQTPSIAELRNLALREHPSTTVVKIEGLVLYKGGAGQADREIMIDIDDEDELQAYLSHVLGGAKATFVVLLQ